ncbi:MAG: hypothetical protein ACTHJ2_09420 [Candidatus Nitrosocosmicus sp.]
MESNKKLYDKKYTLLRTLRLMSGVQVKDIKNRYGVNKKGGQVTSLHKYEKRKFDPDHKTIKGISESLGINPDILFYTYGLLPEEDREIIKEDPFFYMEKIKKLLNNHEKRYGKKNVDMAQLNINRCYDYIEKSKSELSIDNLNKEGNVDEEK